MVSHIRKFAISVCTFLESTQRLVDSDRIDHVDELLADGRARHEEHLDKVADQAFTLSCIRQGSIRSLPGELRFLVRGDPTAFAVSMSSRVRIQVRSASNSAKVPTMPKNVRPFGRRSGGKPDPALRPLLSKGCTPAGHATCCSPIRPGQGRVSSRRAFAMNRQRQAGSRSICHSRPSSPPAARDGRQGTPRSRRESLRPDRRCPRRVSGRDRSDMAGEAVTPPGKEPGDAEKVLVDQNLDLLAVPEFPERRFACATALVRF